MDRAGASAVSAGAVAAALEEVLDLSGNPVTDLRPLSGMQALEALRLDAGADLSVLDGLGSLDALDVRDAVPAGVLESGADER